MLNRAIVIGYSMTGKLAARVLSSYFKEVHVFERDACPVAPEIRKGIPQSAQPHVLLKKGAQLMEYFFPGILEELLHNGAASFDFTKEVHWVHHGLQKIRAEGGFQQLSQSRPMLEWHIQKRVDALTNLIFHFETSVEDFLWSEKEARVQGVAFKTKDGPQLRTLEADLVIDASGAASLFQKNFKKQGIALPKEEVIKVDLAYVSQRVKLKKSVERDWETLILYPNPPHLERGGIVYPLENEEWMVTLFGYGGDHPPTDQNGFKAFAKDLTSPLLFELLSQVEPLSSPIKYRFPQQYRRRFEHIAHPPAGLLVMGDAFYRFDPVFGQGMTAASLEAQVLEEVLQASKTAVESPRFVKTVYKRWAKRLSPLWLMVMAEDFMYSQTKGQKLLGLSLLQRYMKSIYRLSELDPYVYQAFSRVLHLLQSPFSLFHPKILFKVLRKRGY